MYSDNKANSVELHLQLPTGTELGNYIAYLYPGWDNILALEPTICAEYFAWICGNNRLL